MKNIQPENMCMISSIKRKYTFFSVFLYKKPQEPSETPKKQ